MSTVSHDTLKQLYRQPSARALDKVLPQLDQHSRHFIELSPLVVISTQDQQGFADLSPRGGSAGFVKSPSSQQLLIPDAKGNNRLDTFNNLLHTPNIGLMFMVPGIDEVLRVKGSARLQQDEVYLQQVLSPEFTPTLVIDVEVHECFFHCGKALMRSKLWNSEQQIERSRFPSLGQIMKDQQHLEGEALSQQQVEQHYKETL
jgi:PPOX class probable FMN-dependent enzyme